jgi:flavodoxin
MEATIVYESVHHGNTKKIAEAIAGVLRAKLVTAREASPDSVARSDLIGFGSGIYGGRHHTLLLKFVDGLPRSDGKQAFIFSTSGGPNGSKSHRRLREALARKGFAILGEFSCKGFDTFGPFKLIGGLNKGRPNEQDIADAERFARELRAKEA